MKRQNILLNCREWKVLPCMFFLGGVAPHIFQFIKTTAFWHHDMDHYIHIIDQYPLQGLCAFVFVGEFATVLLDFRLY